MDELDDKLRAMANEYHEPPALDRERVWARIGERRDARGERTHGDDVVRIDERRDAPRVARRPSLVWMTAIAAVLAIGFVLGRGSVPSNDARRATHAAVTNDVAATSGAVTPNTQANAMAVAAAGHIRQAETYLTLFRASARGGAPDDAAIPAARALLATNRLLASAPGADPKLRQLLLDLELVLVQITQLEGSDRPEDVRMITDGLDQAGTLTRLRSASPRYPASLTTGVS